MTLTSFRLFAQVIIFIIVALMALATGLELTKALSVVAFIMAVDVAAKFLFMQLVLEEAGKNGSSNAE